jgi:Ca2+-binding EF-hand superfamily protein
LTSCGVGALPLCAAEAPGDAAGGSGALFDRLDANHDGSLTADEVPADKRPLFERLLRSSDKDRNGSLSREELIDGLKSQRPQRELEDKTNLPAAGPAGLPNPEQLFARLDANNDGKVTPDEVPEQGRERFEQLLIRADKNNDGAISKQEMIDGINSFVQDLKAGQDAMRSPAAMFKYLDANGDNKVSLDEVPEERREGFAKLLKLCDKNQDGGLNEDEFVAGMNAVKFFQGVKGDSPAPPAKADAPSASSDSASKAKPAGAKAARLAKLAERNIDADRLTARLMQGDKNGDGKLSRDEVPEQLAKRFEKADANGDGFLDESEVHAAAERLKSAMSKLSE